MKTVVVTGGNDGIGRAFAELFAKKGFRVAVLDLRIDRWTGEGYACDIRDAGRLRECFGEIGQKYGGIDILVNAAGVQIVERFSEYEENRWKRIMDTNYFGTCNVIFEALRQMSAGGRILNVLSVHSSRPRTGKIAYDCSKSALEMLTKELALELAPRGITVNGLSFGAVETSMNAEWRDHPEQREEAMKKVPLGIIFQPEDIARFGYTICTEFAPYTTGSIFIVDGGRSLV